MTPPWLKFIPSSLRTRIEHRPHLLKAMSNTGWLFGDHAIRMGVGLFVGVWMARYLGPEQFGLLSYALAFVALFGAIASLGLNGIVVRELVKYPESAPETLGSAFLLRIAGGALAFVLVVVAIDYARPHDSLVKLMVVLLGFVLVFKAAEVVKCWFESQVQSKYTVWVENTAYLLFALVKVALILGEAPLIAFVWALSAEGLLAAIGLMAVYAWRGGHLRMWRPTFGRAGALLKDSWPLILSGLAIMVYMRIDQIMLGQMLGDEAVGIYSAAVRISEAWYFIPTAIVASVFPSIIEAKKQSEELYYQRLQRLYDLMVVLALLAALPVTLLSDWLIALLFGENYAGAGAVLTVHVWAALFVFINVASGRWIYAENLARLALRRALLGAAMNVLMNWLLIPHYGIVGAAWATLVSFAVSAFFSDMFSRKTRVVFYQKAKALALVNLARQVSRTFKSI